MKLTSLLLLLSVLSPPLVCQVKAQEVEEADAEVQDEAADESTEEKAEENKEESKDTEEVKDDAADEDADAKADSGDEDEGAAEPGTAAPNNMPQGLDADLAKIVSSKDFQKQTTYEDYDDPDKKVVVNPNITKQVKFFDIAGIKLGQSVNEVKAVFKKSKNKYRLADIENKIPEYFTYNYDRDCRARNILTSESLKLCIKGLAKKDNMEYVSKMVYTKPDTKEQIHIFFTSPITKNTVWKVEYKNDANKKLGDAINFQYQRDEERRAFWYSVIKKYGEPIVAPNKWVYNKGDKYSISLTAKYNSLILENPKQNAFDVLEATKKARRDFKYTKYTF